MVGSIFGGASRAMAHEMDGGGSSTGYAAADVEEEVEAHPAPQASAAQLFGLY